LVVLVSETFQAKPNTTTTMRRDFARVVAPLEQAAGRRLGNPYRRVCLGAFERFPEGVRSIARASLADASVNPLGLFLWRIKNGWHELEPVEDAPPVADDAAIGESPVELASADRLVAQRPGLAQWLRNAGAEYAESPTDFGDELALVFKITDAAIAEALREIALGNDGSAAA
jgi:hypothetical protein